MTMAEKVTMNIYPDYEVTMEHEGHGAAILDLKFRNMPLGPTPHLAIPVEILRAIGAYLLKPEFCTHQDFMVMGNVTSMEVKDV